MALQPPSFFQAPSKTSQQPNHEKKLTVSQEAPATRGVPCVGQLLPASGLSSPLPGTQHAAVLTSDLLAVEAHLQSRVRILEEEKRSLLSRIVDIEKSLVHKKEESKTQLEIAETQHRQALLEVKCCAMCCRLVYKVVLHLNSDDIGSEGADY